MGMLFCCAVAVGEALGQKLLLANQAMPTTAAGADDPDQDLGPHRPHREPVAAALASGVDQQGDYGEDPMRAIPQVNVPPIDPCAPPPISWKLGSSPDTDAPLD